MKVIKMILNHFVCLVWFCCSIYILRTHIHAHEALSHFWLNLIENVSIHISIQTIIKPYNKWITRTDPKQQNPLTYLLMRAIMCSTRCAFMCLYPLNQFYKLKTINTTQNWWKPEQRQNYKNIRHNVFNTHMQNHVSSENLIKQNKLNPKMIVYCLQVWWIVFCFYFFLVVDIFWIFFSFICHCTK